MGNDTEQPSGRFVVRIDPQLHAVLRSRAADAGVSLNEFCARKLRVPGDATAEWIAGVVEQASAVLGRELVGVVAFGSWAREAMSDLSDIDILVVAGPDVSIRRELYDQWDEEPGAIGSRPVEPHFARLVNPDGAVSGLWAEVALDGIVLYEKEFAVSRALGRIRRRIAAGELVRRSAHGHPYWTEAA